MPAVYVILRREDGRILFLRRVNTGFADGKYGLPSGHVDGGEPARLAAVREIREEVGVGITEDDLEFVHFTHQPDHDGNGEYIGLFFVATSWDGEPENCEPEKHDILSWMYPDEIPEEEQLDYIVDVLEHISNKRTYSQGVF